MTFYRPIQHPVLVEKPVYIQTPPKVVYISLKERDCLANAVYYEAGNQSELGMKAVAHVIVNRTKSNLFPNTACAVVKQRYNHHCQFSYVCFGKLRKPDPTIYTKSKSAAEEVLKGEKDFTKNSLYYHASYVNPQWHRYHYAMTIGQHMFYNLTGTKYGYN